MLKRIDPDEVELGMFIHKLEGSWLRHPFWKTRFVLADPRMLDKLRNSEVDGVIIDTAHGADLTRGPARSASTTALALANGNRPSGPRGFHAAPPPAPAHPSVLPPPAAALRSAPVHGIAREFGKARTIAEKGEKVISRVFIEARLGKGVKVAVVKPVVEEIYASVQRNPHAFSGLMSFRRDAEHLYRHALAVAALMVSLGRQLGLPPDQVRRAGMIGLLVDIGIAYLPTDLPGCEGDYRRLPPAVFEDHARLGHQFLETSGLPDDVARACFEHHERMDGAGYPRRLGGGSISLFGRMAALCNAYDEMVNGEDGTGGIDPARALSEMLGDPGGFDSRLVARFIEAMGAYPLGSVVMLRSGRLAIVVNQNGDDPALPVVRCFYSSTLGKEIRPVDIDLAHSYGADAIEGLADSSAYGLGDPAALRARLLEPGKRTALRAGN